MNRPKTAREHVIIRRELLKKSARASYAFFRVATTSMGSILFLLFALSPIFQKTLVPHFSLIIFIILLALLSISEIVFRAAQYSNDSYKDEKLEDSVKIKHKAPFLIRLALRFPARGLHLFLVTLWTILAMYYLVFSAFATLHYFVNPVCPENFLFSFYIVAGATALDFIAKLVFIFRVPTLGQFIGDVVSIVVHSHENIFFRFIKRIIHAIFK